LSAAALDHPVGTTCCAPTGAANASNGAAAAHHFEILMTFRLRVVVEGLMWPTIATNFVRSRLESSFKRASSHRENKNSTAINASSE